MLKLLKLFACCSLLGLFLCTSGFALGPVNLNTATAEELTALPGIGQSIAEKIIAYREAHPFKTTEELMEVKGIGQAKFEALKDQISVEAPAKKK